METTLRKFHENPRMQRGPKIHKEKLWEIIIDDGK